MISVTDATGTELRLEKPAQRIVSLAPHLTELAYSAGAGDYLVATVDHADFPEAAKKLPRIGSHNSLDVEKLLALKPDLILVWKSGNSFQQMNYLRSLGLKLYVSEHRGLDDISRTIMHLSVLANTEAQAQKTIADFRTGIDGIKQQYKNRKPVRYFYQIWDKPLMTLNGSHLISRSLRLCAGENVFDSVNGLAPVVSREALLLANPQVILGGVEQRAGQQWLNELQQWPEIMAVKNQQIFLIEPDLISRQSTRMLKGIRLLCEHLDEARQLYQITEPAKLP